MISDLLIKDRKRKWNRKRNRQRKAKDEHFVLIKGDNPSRLYKILNTNMPDLGAPNSTKQTLLD